MLSLASLRASAPPREAELSGDGHRDADPLTESLRAVAGLLTEGVMVVTAGDGLIGRGSVPTKRAEPLRGGPGSASAEVATSASLVTTDPPLVLACLDGRSPVLAELLSDRRFTLHLLDGGDYGRPPQLADARATLRCEVHDIADGGALTIVVGRVTAIAD